MYYRYTGVWLKDLVNGSAVLKAADGSTVTVPAADTGKYFIVSGYTASKSSTNVSEGKRYTYALAQPQVIIPGDGTLVGEAEAAAEGNKKVTVAVEELQSIQNGSGGRQKINAPVLCRVPDRIQLPGSNLIGMLQACGNLAAKYQLPQRLMGLAMVVK